MLVFVYPVFFKLLALHHSPPYRPNLRFPCWFITDAANALQSAIQEGLEGRLNSKNWRSAQVDMNPIHLGKGALLLPGIPLDLMLTAQRNVKEQFFIRISNMQVFARLSGMTSTRVLKRYVLLVLFSFKPFHELRCIYRTGAFCEASLPMALVYHSEQDSVELVLSAIAFYHNVGGRRFLAENKKWAISSGAIIA
jgi:hypothetical protein